MPVPKPIVVLADEGTLEERSRFIWAGASTYLSDPTDPELVDRAVGMLLDVAPWR
jgi:DNA-binding response OmpR family regulator